MTNAFPMFLHVGKLKKPSRQFCQQFTETSLISEVELSHEYNLIPLNYRSKMLRCLVFIHQIERKVLTLSCFQLMREETSKKYAGPCLHLPPFPSIMMLMSTPERNIMFHCRSKTSPRIIFFSNLQRKAWMLTAIFISLSTNRRTHWYTDQSEGGSWFAESR